MITELWNSGRGRQGDDAGTARPLAALASTYGRRPAARQAIDLVYRHGGSTSFKARQPARRVLARTLHTVGQTVTLAPEWYPIGGRVYLGIDPGPRLR